MKKAIYLVMVACIGVLFASCEKDEIGGTATEALAGEWELTVDAVDDAGNVVMTDPFGVGVMLGLTYNTTDNVADKLYVSDLGNFWDYTVVVNADCNNLTFSSNGAVPNEAYDCMVNIEGGRMLPGAATTPSGRPADSLVYYVSFDDDDYPAAYGYSKYKVSGYRRTGFAADEP